MEGAPVTAATGALGPVISKLSALLGSEYKLRWRTRRDVKFIRCKLKPVHSILWNIWEREELDEASKALKMEALDLADDVEDAIDDFILEAFERSRIKKRLVQTKIKASPFQDFKKRASDVSGRCRSKWKKPSASLLSCGKIATDDSCPSKPRAYPFVRKDASELVGIVGPRDKLIQHLVREDEGTPVEPQRKKAFIYGTAGMGKTTLVDLVYEAIGDNFQYRAFVSVTPGGNMREVLARILEQVAHNSSVPFAAGTQAYTEEHLIGIISNFLKDKRYLVIIDDIWNLREWEVIMNSLPENNLGSRILGTTCVKSVEEKWHEDLDVPNVLFYKMLPTWYKEKGLWFKEEGLVDEFGDVDIVTGMVAMKPDLVAEGFDDEHHIVRMCDGTPLAVRCMLSAVAQEQEKQAQLGLNTKACDVQDEIAKQVQENGIQNTPGFEPLVERLQLLYDDLPHHMIKTCLLFCGIYHDGIICERDHLVRRWISEGFVCKEEEANGYFEELVNRGLFLRQPVEASLMFDMRMHPMMHNFLRWKSRQDNFITCSSKITPSYNSTCRIRRLCLCHSPCRSSDAAADPLSALDWSHIRSLTVFGSIKIVPFEKLEVVRVLDLHRTTSLECHLEDISGLFRLRHLLSFNRQTISQLPSGIVRLKQLKTLDVVGGYMTRLPSGIGALQQMETLRIINTEIKQLPKEIGELHQLKTLAISRTAIDVLPKEIGELKKLRTLDISCTPIEELPKEIGELKQLRALNICATLIKVLPKEIGELQHLENLLMLDTKVTKMPREIGALTELKRLQLGYNITLLPLEVCAFVELPQCIHKALMKSDLVSDLIGELLSYQHPIMLGEEGALVVGAKQMDIPPWITEHFSDLTRLDIRICKLEEAGLKILREMPELLNLTLRFEVVPREPIVISSEGFATLKALTVDSRVPRVTFQEGAMPELQRLIFEFQFYSGPPNKDPVGINYLKSLENIEFKCNKTWYGGGDSPCILPTIDVVRKEAKELPSLSGFQVCGCQEYFYLQGSSDDEQKETEERSGSRRRRSTW